MTPGWMHAPIGTPATNREHRHQDARTEDIEHHPPRRRVQACRLKPVRRRPARTGSAPCRTMLTLGVVLVLVGAVLMVAEAHVPSHGALGSGAAAALTAGVVLVLTGAGAPGAAIVAAGAAVALVAVLLAGLVVAKSLATRRLTVRSGAGTLVGRVGTVRRVPAPLGQVQLDGALWRARLWGLETDGPLTEGSPVVVER